MSGKKVYGQSKIENCPFCEERALSMNKQGVATCTKHKDRTLDIKCSCGSWLDIRPGKWGAYANCVSCGNMSLRKALALGIKPDASAFKEVKKKDTSIAALTSKKHPKEITITSDDIGVYY
jgi:hypothetical protein